MTTLITGRVLVMLLCLFFVHMPFVTFGYFCVWYDVDGANELILILFANSWTAVVAGYIIVLCY